MSAAAISAPLIAAIAERGWPLLIALVLALGLAVLRQVAFARPRGRPAGWDGAVTAVVFVTLMPARVSLSQLGLAMSFRLVMGDLVFGGRGRGFLSPAAVGLAFLLYSFPTSDTAAGFGMGTALAAVAGGALLLGARILSWRVVAGCCAATIALRLAWPMPGDWPVWPGATLIVGLMFLIGNPVAAACTDAGRWAYGLLAGALVVVLGHQGHAELPAVVFPALLATIFAQSETPGLGARIADPAWQVLWAGRRAVTPSGKIVISVVRGNATGPSEVDGISGATRSGIGVARMVRFWLGPEGFGPFLARLRSGEIR
ncbi:hypothetical protein U879_06235 [Defluviimonas sp. 20V17]|uniref:Na+-transporting NADH:ubiquinone oxidoreductase subunit B n=1 Tax=Allgaiera indica TaxID=765699 RepID=A0AAN4ZYG9_9RHOB|nr:RnfABCDGE type electron transport complex subunit D [Allgaiera indica]KDB04589.1 hypothetical protein U879_06235 [Defluviimonas sp. 20V17]GHD99720.1 hypothetical protein GCM10008024_08230 [Allgaiera indica]SDW19812.1 Na+-transporting NADH:ubiquinone oxidoreductase subunit B [Allgaiera indica]